MDASNTCVAFEGLGGDVTIDELYAEPGRDLCCGDDEGGKSALIDGVVELRPRVGFPHQCVKGSGIDPSHLIVGWAPQYAHWRSEQVQGNEAVHVCTCEVGPEFAQGPWALWASIPGRDGGTVQGADARPTDEVWSHRMSDTRRQVTQDETQYAGFVRAARTSTSHYQGEVGLHTLSIG